MNSMFPTALPRPSRAAELMSFSPHGRMALRSLLPRARMQKITLAFGILCSLEVSLGLGRSVAGTSQSAASSQHSGTSHDLGNTAHFFLKLRAHEEEYGKSAHGAARQSQRPGARSFRNQIRSFLFLPFQLGYPCTVRLCLSLESTAYGLACDPKLFCLERTVTKIKNSILIKPQHYLAPKSQTLSVKRTRSKVFVRPDMQRSGIHKKLRTVMEVDTPQLIRRQSIDSRRVGHFLDLGSLLISNHSETPAICLCDL